MAYPQTPHDPQPYPLGLRLAGRGSSSSVAAPSPPAGCRRCSTPGPPWRWSRPRSPRPCTATSPPAVSWSPRAFRPDDLDDTWLVQVAIDDPAAAAQISAAAEERRIFCVRADDRQAASAWTPAVTRSGPVTVAVLGGGDPRRAMAVRDAVRALLADAGSRRQPAGAPVPAAGEPAEGGSVALVGSGPGDPELITVKGRRLLAEADVVVADRLVPGLLLDELRADVELVDASKIPYGPSRTQEEINRIIVERALAGATVVRLKGGDPYVFGRGGEELLACAAAGVPVSVVPGVTSAVSVPAAAGVPVTHRGVAHEFTVVSGHLPPATPTRW